MTEHRYTIRRVLRLEPEIATLLERHAASENLTLSAFVSELVRALGAPRISHAAACERLEEARRAALGGSADRPRGAARRSQK